MPVSSGCEAKNRLYLQKLQLRNQLRRQQREAQEQTEAERLKREQNFNVCFSGANNQRITQGGRGRSSRSSGCVPDGGWRQWDERTVEIVGAGGQVFAVRPNGAHPNSNLQAVAKDFDDKGVTVRAAASLSNSGDAPPAMFNATQRELCDLLAELGGLPSEPEQDEANQADQAHQADQATQQILSHLANTVEDAYADGTVTDNVMDATPTAPTSPLSSSALLAEAAKALGESSPSEHCKLSPTSKEIARRIQRLSACRRQALLAQTLLKLLRPKQQ